MITKGIEENQGGKKSDPTRIGLNKQRKNGELKQRVFSKITDKAEQNMNEISRNRVVLMMNRISYPKKGGITGSSGGLIETPAGVFKFRHRQSLRLLDLWE